VPNTAVTWRRPGVSTSKIQNTLISYTTHSNDTDRCIDGQLQLNGKISSCARFVARPYWSAAVSVRGRFDRTPTLFVPDLQRFFCWYVTSRCDLDIILTTWSWTFVVYRLWSDQTLPNLNEIEQSAAESLRLKYVQSWRRQTSFIWSKIVFFTILWHPKPVTHHWVKFQRNRAMHGWVIDDSAHFCRSF